MNNSIKKALGYGIPIVAIILFLAIMLSGPFLKQSFGKTDDFLGYLSALSRDVQKEDWKSAEDNIDNLVEAWHKVEKRVQFSEERNQMNEIDVNLARLRGAINAKDKNSAKIEISEAHEHWNDMGT